MLSKIQVPSLYQDVHTNNGQKKTSEQLALKSFKKTLKVSVPFAGFNDHNGLPYISNQSFTFSELLPNNIQTTRIQFF